MYFEENQPVNKEGIERICVCLELSYKRKISPWDLLLLDSAVMLIEVGNHKSIEYIDTYFLPDYAVIPQAVAVVAEREGLADNWLSSAIAGFTYIFRKEPPY